MLFPWVLEVEGEGMLCGLFRKHTHRPPKAVVGKTIWVDVLCVTITQQSLSRHDTSSSNLDAKKLEAGLLNTIDEYEFHTVNINYNNNVTYSDSSPCITL